MHHMREIGVHNFPLHQQDAVLDWPASIIRPDNVLAAGHCATQKRVEPICANMIWWANMSMQLCCGLHWISLWIWFTPCFSPASICNIGGVIWTICSLGCIYNISLAHNYSLETCKTGQRKGSPHFEMETSTLGSFHSLKFVLFCFVFFFFGDGSIKMVYCKKIDIGKHPSN